jgi:phytoene synthase
MSGDGPDPVADLVRAADFDRYASTLFAPAVARPHLLALYAFDSELARIRDLVSEPMPGEIRLQWWRDVIEAPERSDAAGHPVARALEGAIAHGQLPRGALLDLIDARADDLYDDPVASIGELEGRLGATVSSMLRLACLVTAAGRDPGGADVAGFGGVALGIVRTLKLLPAAPARAQALLPVDLMTRHDVSRDEVIAGRSGAGLSAVVSDLRALARRRLVEARMAFRTLEPSAAAATLPLALVERDLSRLERPGREPLARLTDEPRWLRMLALWRASRRAPPF